MGPFLPAPPSGRFTPAEISFKVAAQRRAHFAPVCFYFSANILSSEITTMTPSFDMNGVARLESGVRTEN